MSRHRIVSFRDLDRKAAWLDANATLDAMTHPVRDMSRGFATAGRSTEQIATAIHRWVRDNIRYQTDAPKMTGAMGEEFASSEEILRRGYDDCDGKARLFVALCRAANIESRVRPVHKGPDFTHVQAEVRWPGSERRADAEPDGWILAELIVDGCELGADPRKIRPFRVR